MFHIQTFEIQIIFLAVAIVSSGMSSCTRVGEHAEELQSSDGEKKEDMPQWEVGRPGFDQEDTRVGSSYEELIASLGKENVVDTVDEGGNGRVMWVGKVTIGQSITEVGRIYSVREGVVIESHPVSGIADHRALKQDASQESGENHLSPGSLEIEE